MRVQVLYVVRGEDGIDGTRGHSRHIGHGAGDVRRHRRIDVEPDLRPRIGIKAAGGLRFALRPAADVENGFHNKNPVNPVGFTGIFN